LCMASMTDDAYKKEKHICSSFILSIINVIKDMMSSKVGNIYC
jgi:hypothetical protein